MLSFLRFLAPLSSADFIHSPLVTLLLPLLLVLALVQLQKQRLRQPTTNKPHDMTQNPALASPALPHPLKNSRARPNSLSKGINLNTVSPQPESPIPRSEPSGPASNGLNSPSSCPTIKISAKDAPKLSIDEQLRLLALREMALVELKDKIATLNAQFQQSEKELQIVRATIQRNLYREMHIAAVANIEKRRWAPSAQQPPTKGSASRRPKLKLNALSKSLKDSAGLALTGPDTGKAASTSLTSDSASVTVSEETSVKTSTLNLRDARHEMWPGNASKDASRSKEVSRAKVSPETPSSQFTPSEHFVRSPRPIALAANIETPLVEHKQSLYVQKLLRAGDSALASLYASSGSLETFKEALAETIHFRDPEVMLQTVSNSLWSFVNEVKQSVLAPAMSSGLLDNSDCETFSDRTSDDEAAVDLSVHSSTLRPKGPSH